MFPKYSNILKTASLVLFSLLRCRPLAGDSPIQAICLLQRYPDLEYFVDAGSTGRVGENSGKYEPHSANCISEADHGQNDESNN